MWFQKHVFTLTPNKQWPPCCAFLSSILGRWSQLVCSTPQPPACAPSHTSCSVLHCTWSKQIHFSSLLLFRFFKCFGSIRSGLSFLKYFSILDHMGDCYATFYTIGMFGKLRYENVCCFFFSISLLSISPRFLFDFSLVILLIKIAVFVFEVAL